MIYYVRSERDGQGEIERDAFAYVSPVHIRDQVRTLWNADADAPDSLSPEENEEEPAKEEE